MADRLSGKTVAVLVTDGFERVELTKPVEALRGAGAEVMVVAPSGGSVRGFNHFDEAESVPVDVTLDRADPERFDALLIPGGNHSPDQLRVMPEVQSFVRAFFEAEKPVAAICHAPWVLIDAGVVEGRRVTSYHTLRRDLINAGAEVVDEEVVVDNGLITSRNPDDLPAFCAKLVEEIEEGRHRGQAAGVAAPRGEGPSPMH